MAFVQFTQPDDQPIVINTERIVTAAPAPPDGQGTRITFTNGGHQDVKELIADVLRRLNIKCRLPDVSLANCEQRRRLPPITGRLCHRRRWLRCIRSFIMKSGCRSCALAAVSSSALGISRRKITHTSTSIWAMPTRSFARIARRYSVSTRAWAHMKLTRGIVPTVTWTENFIDQN